MPGSTYIKAKKAHHTNASPSSLPYTPPPKRCPNPPALHPPTYPTTHTCTAHAAQAAYPTPPQPRSAACRDLAAPYPSQPTLQPPPSNNPSPPSPDRLPYTHSPEQRTRCVAQGKAPTPATSASPTKEPTQQPATSSPRPAYPIPAPAQTSRNHAQVPARKSVQVLQLFNHTSHLPVRPPSSVASGLSLGNLGEEGLTLSRS
jgi:hypothetical protein